MIENLKAGAKAPAFFLLCGKLRLATLMRAKDGGLLTGAEGEIATHRHMQNDVWCVDKTVLSCNNNVRNI